MAFLSCNNKPEVDYAIISGKITNKPLGEISINSMDRSFSEPLVIAEDGTFVDTLTLGQHSYVLYDGKNPVFLNLQPGFNLNIKYDANNFENTLSITGHGFEVNNYLIAKRKTQRELFGNPNETYLLNEADFTKKAAMVKNGLLDVLADTKGLENAFVEKETRDINYIYLSFLNDYKNAHAYFTKNQDFKPSESFLKDFEGFNYTNEEDFKESSNYKRLVTDYFTKEARKLAKEQAMESDLAFVKTVSNIKSESIKNGLLYEFANFNMNYSKDIDSFYEAFIANSTNEAHNEIITEKYAKLTALAKGKPSPKFVNYENYQGGTTSLDDLKGKYVYIDVWATWCGPCKREIPFLKEVEEKFHDKNIEFVSVSIDQMADHDKWKAMVQSKELGGMQLMADKDWNSSFVKDYQIQGIPRFILIDPNGNIVDPNAPRPSNPKLETLLNSENI